MEKHYENFRSILVIFRESFYPQIAFRELTMLLHNDMSCFIYIVNCQKVRIGWYFPIVFLDASISFLKASTLCFYWSQWLHQPEPCHTMLLIQSLSSDDNISFFRFGTLALWICSIFYLFLFMYIYFMSHSIWRIHLWF